jgi:hypothetical protein
MATTIRMKYAGSLNGTGPIYREFQVNDSQTIYKGDMVILDTNKASIATYAASAGTVLGVSATDIVTTTAADTDIIKVDINPGSVYEVPITGTAGSVAVGNKYDMGTAAYQLDADDTTDGYIQVLPQYDGSAYNTDKTTAYAIICNRVYGLA